MFDNYRYDIVVSALGGVVELFSWNGEMMDVTKKKLRRMEGFDRSEYLEEPWGYQRLAVTTRGVVKYTGWCELISCPDKGSGGSLKRYRCSAGGSPEYL